VLFSGLRQELALVVGVGLAFAVLGALTDHYQAAACAGLLVYSLWHVLQLVRLSWTLKRRDKVAGLHTYGLWQGVYGAVSRLQDRSRKRKRGLALFYTRFRNAATALPDAAAILGKNFEVEWVNPAAKRLLDIWWPVSEGQPIADVVRHPALREYLNEGRFDRPLVFSPSTRSGLVLSLLVTPFGTEDQSLLVARDITQVHHLNQIRRDFVSNVSHELRSPLTVLRGFLEMLAGMEDMPEPHKRAVQVMQQQSDRMQSITQDLLTLSRLEMGESPDVREDVEVADLLESIVDEARILSGEARHDIRLEADPDLWLRGSESELRSAFANLVFNAVRHTPGRSFIGVRWEEVEGEGIFQVRDTGEGIAARHLPRLTERFYRVDEARSRESGGTGLGLAIVKHVLTRHDAVLEIESEIGRGSVFRCRFPEKITFRSES
jgi:two-component system phosphate regulon sensor histidine kinase PhoR